AAGNHGISQLVQIIGEAGSAPTRNEPGDAQAEGGRFARADVASPPHNASAATGDQTGTTGYPTVSDDQGSARPADLSRRKEALTILDLRTRCLIRSIPETRSWDFLDAFASRFTRNGIALSSARDVVRELRRRLARRFNEIGGLRGSGIGQFIGRTWH